MLNRGADFLPPRRRVRREKDVRILSRSPGETHRIGVELARKLKIPGVLFLRGPLGTGKTTLARGVAEGLGLADPSLVSSPSFSLVNIYHGKFPIFHVDLYRISGGRELRSIGIEDFLEKEGVTIVEWSERMTNRLQAAIEVEIEDAGEDARWIRIWYPAISSGRRRGRPQTVAKSVPRRRRLPGRLGRGRK